MDASPIHSAPTPPSIASAFELALAMAAERRGATAPHPTVGCVLLDEAGQPLAAAAHQRAGEGHAEVNALAQCRETGTLQRIHTAIVTLEPCNHWGRTPPCVEALLATSVHAVWIGAADPNAMASGGAARLAAAGIEVRLIDATSPLGMKCADLIAPFAKRQATGRPWVTVKQAFDPVGSMIPPQGRTTFTSQSALTYAHRLRRRADAILTGSGTVLADDPAFTVRHVADHGGKRRPLAVLDRRGRVPDTWLEAAAARGLDAYRATNVETALDELGRQGALEVLVEAGPGLSEAVLRSGLWDEHVLVRQASPETAPSRLETVEVRRRDPARTQSFTFQEAECSPA